MFLFSAKTMAAPSGADLLRACEDSIKNGFDTKAGMLCIWYVTPCDCNFAAKKQLPRVCLPEDKSHESLAKEVMTGLQQQPGLKTETAEMAAAKILSLKYPCSD